MGAYDDILNDKPKRGAYDDILEPSSESGSARNVMGGLARSGMGIVSNLMRPFESVIPGGEDFDSGNQKRMERVNQRFQTKVYDPESLAFQGGKLAGDVAITAPVGGLLAKGVGMIPVVTKYAPSIPSALRSGGMTLAAPGGKIANVATRVGAGATTGGAMAGLSDFDNAKSGAMFGAALPVVGMGGQVVSDKVLKPAARKLMQSAVKPTIEQLRKGDAQVAIDTLLKYGVNPTERGVEKLRGIIDDINTKITNKIAGSNAMVGRDDVLGYLGGVRSKFTNQVDADADLGAIQGVADRFANHPYFQRIEAQGQPLVDDLARASLGKTQALQAAGKLRTFAAQQQNLAHGGGVKLAPIQPQNQLYMNTGATGRTAVSPSAYPTQLAPRVPGRYTHNIDRVPEGDAGFTDAMRAYEQRKADEIAAQKAVEAWQASRGKLPVQQAQTLKQGTYKALKDKYGEAGSAATEAQKALARGLKEEIGKAVPDVVPLNAEEARLLKTLGVAERRALMELNKNPVGLAALAQSPGSFAAFMADRSAAFKSIVARMLNRTAELPPMVNPALANPAVRAGLLSTQDQ